MKRRSSASGEPARSRRPKSSKSKGRNRPKVQSSRSSRGGAETEATALRRELHEALEQQTATAEILASISGSTGDTRHVFETILDNLLRLFGTRFALILLIRDGMLHVAGLKGESGFEKFAENYPLPLDDRLHAAKAILAGRALQIVPVIGNPEAAPITQKLAPEFGYNALLSVPMIHDGKVIGVLNTAHRDPIEFTDKQVALIKSFAAQAVIAIENARLLNELRQRTTDLTERTADLTEALEQQTATSEVLQVISSSPGDLQPVFAAMLENAVRICNATFGNIYRAEDDGLRIVATHKTPPAFAEARGRSPVRPNPNNILGRMIATKKAVHVLDAAEQREQFPEYGTAVELGGVRTCLAVPMLKENELIGSISLFRQKVLPFTDKQIALVTNFAAQAVIAIESTRLLKQLRERTEEVEKLNQHLEHRVADQVGEIERMGRLRRFLPPQVADLIVASGTEKQLESHRREIAALFCDLRGFTGFTESADAEDVIALLREYHAAIGEKIIKYSGTLERYAGDGVMVVFNDPVPIENPALQAVLMALEMREAIGALTETWRRLGHDIGFGIGIAHGFATLGTIGFEGRFDYAAIGTVSNVASRLCDEAKPGQILISARVLTKVEDAVKVEQVGEFELKGIRRPLAAYNIIAAKSAD
jgi:class 3 adenylate cyclase